MPEHWGKTFSPAQSWFDGGPAFAFEKLEEVRAMLLEQATEEEAKKRRHRDRQRVYDLQDAATTISDAIHYIDPEGELRGELAAQELDCFHGELI